MEHTIERKDGDLIVVVTNTKEEVNKIYGKTVEALCKEVTVKGFRKGKAPIEKARAYLNPQELEDRFVRGLIDKDFRAYVRDPEIQVTLEAEIPDGAVPSVSLGQKGDSVSFVYPLKPVVTKLGEFKGLKTGVTKTEVTDETVQKELERIAHDEADLVPVSDPIEKGFTVNCDIKGKINGIEMATLSEKAFDIKVGTGRFIPGLEDALLGKKEGENLSTECDLPTNYPEEVAGKHAVFDIHVNSVKKEEVPEINDELATVQGEYENCQNLEELKAKIRETLTNRFNRAYDQNRLNNILNQVVNSSEFSLDENRLRDTVVNVQRKADEETLSQQGLDLNTYLKLMNMTQETYAKNVYANLTARMKSEAVEDAIFQASGLEDATEDEVKELAEKNGIKFDEIKANLAASFRESFKDVSDDCVNRFVAHRLLGLYRAARMPKLEKFLLDNND